MSALTYRLPSFSLRFVPVWRRNLLVWRKLAIASVIGNIAEPMITLVAFGYGLGSLLQQIDGVPYIEVLASGSICMSVMMASSFEALYSAPVMVNVFSSSLKVRFVTRKYCRRNWPASITNMAFGRGEEVNGEDTISCVPFTA